MTISLDLVGSVWVFECDVIGTIVKKLRLGCCLFGRYDSLIGLIGLLIYCVASGR